MKSPLPPGLLKFLIFSFFCFAPLRLFADTPQECRFIVSGSMDLSACSKSELDGLLKKMREFDPDFLLFLGGMTSPSGAAS